MLVPRRTFLKRHSPQFHVILSAAKNPCICFFFCCCFLFLLLPLSLFVILAKPESRYLLLQLLLPWPDPTAQSPRVRHCESESHHPPATRKSCHPRFLRSAPPR